MDENEWNHVMAELENKKNAEMEAIDRDYRNMLIVVGVVILAALLLVLI